MKSRPSARLPRAGRRVLALLAGLLLTACGHGITMVASFRPPDAEPLNLRGAKVVAVVMMEDQAIRKVAEDTLAKAITKHGAVGVAMYSLMPSFNPADEASARAALERAQVKGVVVMRPRLATKKTVTPPMTYYEPMYSGYWGGYYPYGWGSPWGARGGMYGGVGYGQPMMYGAPMSSYGKPQGPEHGGDYYSNGYYVGGTAATHVPGHTEIEDVVRVEILVYSLKQNKLAWAGETESTKPSNVNSYVMALADETAEQLAEVRLIWK